MSTDPSSNRALSAWRRLAGLPFGKALFTLVVQWQAPYFRTIPVRFEQLEPGHARLRLRDRWRVHNHLGTVHAIALCNAAELAAGLATDVSIPPSMRWIPKGMTVRYLRKAVGRMTATATLDPRGLEGPPRDLEVVVTVRDPGGDAVLDARITMYLSPRRAA